MIRNCTNKTTAHLCNEKSTRTHRNTTKYKVHHLKSKIYYGTVGTGFLLNTECCLQPTKRLNTYQVLPPTNYLVQPANSFNPARYSSFSIFNLTTSHILCTPWVTTSHISRSYSTFQTLYQSTWYFYERYCYVKQQYHSLWFTHHISLPNYTVTNKKSTLLLW
jgi:hypothetical protein